MYNNKCTFKTPEGRRVALLRHLREMTQKEVAYKLGKSTGYVAAVESGRQKLGDVASWAKIFGVSEKYLKEGGELLLEKW